MSKSDQIYTFNPGDVGVRNGKLFGLPFDYEECQVVILPVPWEVTVSYRTGTALGPQAILDASTQVDLFDPVWPDGWRAGFYLLPISKEWQAKNEALRKLAGHCIAQRAERHPRLDPQSVDDRRAQGGFDAAGIPVALGAEQAATLVVDVPEGADRGVEDIR